MRLLLLLLLSFTLTGCSVFGLSFSRSKPVEIVAKEKERERLNLEIPEPLSIPSTEWILITPDNAESVWEDIKKDGNHPVLFAVTSDGYEQLSFGMVDIRNYIATQRLIIARYKEYYEPKNSEISKKDNKVEN